MREQKVTSANYGNTTTDGCCSGGLQRWTFWRPMVHRMIVAGAAFPPSIQSSRVSWIKVCRTTPVEVGGKPDNWSEKPLWAIWWAKAWRAAALSGTIRVLSKTRLPEDCVLGHAKARALIWNTPSPCWKPASLTVIDGVAILLFLCVCNVIMKMSKNWSSQRTNRAQKLSRNR